MNETDQNKTEVDDTNLQNFHEEINKTLVELGAKHGLDEDTTYQETLLHAVHAIHLTEGTPVVLDLVSAAIRAGEEILEEGLLEEDITDDEEAPTGGVQ